MSAILPRAAMVMIAPLAALCLAGAPPAVETAQEADEAIRAGERLRISVVGLLGEGVETRLTRRVERDGSLRLPGLDASRLDATGMTPAELERSLARLYGQQVLAGEALVVVSRLEAGEDHVLDTRGGGAGAPAGAAGSLKFHTDLAPWPAVLLEPMGKPFELSEVPLEQAIEQLRQRTGLPVWVDYTAMELQGVDRDMPLTLKLPPEVPVGRVIQLVLDTVNGGFADIGYEWHDGVLMISAEENLALKAQTMAVEIPPLLIAEEVMDVITETVRPDAWMVNGGDIGKIQEANGRLVITATPRMLREIQGLLEKIVAP